MTLLAIALLALLAVQQWFHQRERQTLLDRIQAPERVIEQRHTPNDPVLVPAVRFDDDDDYWAAQGIEVPDQ